MSVLGALAAGRAAAERIMLDTCTVTRPGTPATDSAGTVTASASAVYTGACRVQTYEAHESTVPSGGRTRVGQRYKLHLPVGVGPFAVGDVATITASATDAHLVGTAFRVAALFNKSLATSQRLDVDEVAA